MPENEMISEVNAWIPKALDYLINKDTLPKVVFTAVSRVMRNVISVHFHKLNEANRAKRLDCLKTGPIDRKYWELMLEHA